MSGKGLFVGAMLLGLLGLSSWAAEGDIELLTETLPWAAVDLDYSPPPLEARVSGRCPAGGVGFAVASGELPPGLKLSRLGYVTGVPTKTGLFLFTVRANNGCSWSARRLSLLVTDRPKLKTVPEVISVETALGTNPDPVVIRLTATWPQLPYTIRVSHLVGSSGWLAAVPEHGMTSKESVPRRLTEVPTDDVLLRFESTALKPGRYSAEITISAWQALPVTAPVTLLVKPMPGN